MRINESQLIIGTFKTKNKDCEGNTRDLSPPISLNIQCHNPPMAHCSSFPVPSSCLESRILQSGISLVSHSPLSPMTPRLPSPIIIPLSAKLTCLFNPLRTFIGM